MIGADGSDRRRVTHAAGHEEPAAWSPDGKRILFTRSGTDTGVGVVFVVDPDGSHLRRLTSSAADDVAGAFCPHGSKIVFTSERTGHPQLFVMRADGSAQRNISRNAFAEFATSWR